MDAAFGGDHPAGADRGSVLGTGAAVSASLPAPRSARPLGKRPSRRRAKAKRGWSITDPATVERLDAAGVPASVAAQLSGLDVGIALVERAAEVGLSWQLVERVLQGTGCRSAEDFVGLLNLASDGVDDAEMMRWARLGSLDAAVRLSRKNVSLGVVEAFPLTVEHGLADFLRLVQVAGKSGIRPDDLIWWHAAGVVSLKAPWVNESVWGPWRSVAVSMLGLDRAAVAAAAGLSPDEAARQVQAGTFDLAALRMMAGLRAGL